MTTPTLMPRPVEQVRADLATLAALRDHETPVDTLAFVRKHPVAAAALHEIQTASGYSDLAIAHAFRLWDQHGFNLAKLAAQVQGRRRAVSGSQRRRDEEAGVVDDPLGLPTADVFDMVPEEWAAVLWELIDRMADFAERDVVPVRPGRRPTVATPSPSTLPRNVRQRITRPSRAAPLSVKIADAEARKAKAQARLEAADAILASEAATPAERTVAAGHRRSARRTLQTATARLADLRRSDRREADALRKRTPR